MFIFRGRMFLAFQLRSAQIIDMLSQPGHDFDFRECTRATPFTQID
jgi:hypothetical protein